MKIHEVKLGDLYRRSAETEIPSLFVSDMQYKDVFQGGELFAIERERPGQGGEIIAYGTRKQGRLRASARVTLDANQTGDLDAVFREILEVLRRKAVSEISVELIGDSAETGLPSIGPETYRADSEIFVVDLQRDLSLSSNHKRNVKKARKHGITVVESKSAESANAHLAVCGASGARRQERGEFVAFLPTEETMGRYTKRSEDYTFYQAMLDGQVLSSDLIVFCGPYAFYDSGGSSPLGMSKGSSYLLMSSIIESLKDAGLRSLNLGGSSKSRPGLSRFKSGFGADSYHYSTVTVAGASKVAVLAAGLTRLLLRQ